MASASLDLAGKGHAGFACNMTESSVVCPQEKAYRLPPLCLGVSLIPILDREKKSVAIPSSQSASNVNDPRSAEAPSIQSPEVRSTAGRRIDKNQLNAEPAEPP